MRTIKELINQEKKVYIYCKDKRTAMLFLIAAEDEGITFCNGSPATEHQAEDLYALQADGTLCYVGWAGHMAYHYCNDSILKIDYENYANRIDNYQM